MEGHTNVHTHLKNLSIVRNLCWLVKIVLSSGVREIILSIQIRGLGRVSSVCG